MKLWHRQIAYTVIWSGVCGERNQETICFWGFILRRQITISLPACLPA
jgi:hypothetical protein